MLLSGSEIQEALDSGPLREGMAMTTLKSTYYAKPIDIRIRLEPGQVSIHPLGHDALIIMYIGGKRYDALVPTWTLGEGHRSVPALRAGKSGDNEIVYFPISNEGRPTWVIPFSELEKIMAH